MITSNRPRSGIPLPVQRPDRAAQSALFLASASLMLAASAWVTLAGELPSSVGRQDSSSVVTVSRINTEFRQTGGSCVLSSYAIVANYFTGQPIATYFKGYCEHFGLAYTNALDAEQKYAEHFDGEWRKRNCRGYEVILDLHSNSTVKCFVEARRHFDGSFYLDSSAHLHELEDLLTRKQAFLNISYEPGGSYHSITVVHDTSGFMARDTERKGLIAIPSLANIGKLRDSVLYVGK